ncbi:MAG TPA: LON peptidase substrate-binding domain-containing protein [Candidatus Dormibacteraeota bacterium]|nr:LON peptidase substrate-binding domain-containing protein [Candidatus Dormibacteraeota bacterium]
MSAERIPLFPLGIVLFPGQAAPLHIFEPRYRDMARDCIESQSSFGIVLIHQETIARIGCSAMIVKTLREYDDGRSDILIAGQQAFRMIRTYEEKSYFEADVEYLKEDFQEIDSGVSAQLVQLFNQCHRNLYEEDGPPFETEGSISLAYHVASELPIDVTFRQSLLEQRSESERQRLLVARLAEWYLQLQTRDRVRGKTSGNGHGKL